ncbi:MAG: hypothetical protein KAR32_10435, partial [Candidatus Omnitrophica bacterium]|nr:hypothetical protein [Candidatus Omnitrophota bacterium]
IKKNSRPKAFHMKIKNKSFIVFLAIATIMIFGIIAENTRSIIDPQKAEIPADTNEIKNKIQKAGIIPHDAMYWKEL